MRIPNPTIILALLVWAILLGCGGDQKLPPEKEAAINSARQWIALIDSGKYDQSWHIASSTFKKDVTQRQWRIALEQIRAPYGQVKSRKIMETKPLPNKPGAPRQKNLVIEFTTRFENQEPASEFVTVLLDSEGTWLVSAYYLDR